ncbi:twitching motility protein PilT, partial [Cytophagales bacterium RKSG123]|nr:twitching motility protein PilT [Xanthovirga aplysinae]
MLFLSLHTATFRFYEELNDFLPDERKKVDFLYQFKKNPSVKHAIEAIGIPHTEVDLILVNGNSVSFSYQLRQGDRISVYPVFESMDITNICHLRPAPLRETKFILDVHLGKLCKFLRLAGFDTWYDKSYDDSEIVRIAEEQKRIVLTRDKGLLKNKKLSRGYWVRATNPKIRFGEILKRFDLWENIQLAKRCPTCNGLLTPIAQEEIEDKLLPFIRKTYKEFFQCSGCDKIYWKGPHFQMIKKFMEEFK